MSRNPFNTHSTLMHDPTQVINTLPPTTTHTGQGLWSQIQPGSSGPYHAVDPIESKLRELELQAEQQALTIKLMRLKIHALEGKFTQEEVVNIRKMIMSEDEASRTLADSIIENA
jgi:hypothetical protein